MPKQLFLKVIALWKILTDSEEKVMEVLTDSEDKMVELEYRADLLPGKF